jgi:hypothetical protein
VGDKRKEYNTNWLMQKEKRERENILAVGSHN